MSDVITEHRCARCRQVVSPSGHTPGEVCESGAWWLTPEGRSRAATIWEDPERDVPRIYLDALIAAEVRIPSAPPAAETRPETVEETGARYLASLRRHGADEQLLAAATKAAQEVEDDIRKEHA